MSRPVNAIELIRREHRNVRTLLHRFAKTHAREEQRALRAQIIGELRMHAHMEQTLLYPYLREVTGREDLFHEASIEHDIAEDLLVRLSHQTLGTARIQSMMKVLAEQLDHHVRAEEEEILPAIVQTGVDLRAFGAALIECRAGGAVAANHGS